MCHRSDLRNQASNKVLTILKSIDTNDYPSIFGGIDVVRIMNAHLPLIFHDTPSEDPESYESMQSDRELASMIGTQTMDNIFLCISFNFLSDIYHVLHHVSSLTNLLPEAL